jgi:hypothetical protein
MYADNNQGYLPITLTYQRGIANIPGRSGPLIGWATWSHGGKNCSDWWPQNYQGFDIEAADRPLNPYLYPEITWDAPDPPNQMTAADLARTMAKAEVFHDPSDKLTYQRNWPTEDKTISSYDDVGTSYHWNSRWFPDPSRLGEVPPAVRTMSFTQQFDWGTRQMRIADAFLSSRYVWCYDQTSDAVVNQNRANYVNGYGDINRSILSFLDGHAAYLALVSGQPVGQSYTLLFTFTQK